MELSVGDLLTADFIPSTDIESDVVDVYLGWMGGGVEGGGVRDCNGGWHQSMRGWGKTASFCQ